MHDQNEDEIEGLRAHVALLKVALAQAESEQLDAWISVENQMPEIGRIVLAHYIDSLGNGHCVRAEYIHPLSRRAEDGWDFYCDTEYDETTDKTYWPGGWYECVDNWEELSRLKIYKGQVSHWMPIPDDSAISKKR